MHALFNISEVWQYAHRMLRSGRKLVNDQLAALGLSSSEGNILIHLLVHKEPLSQEQLAQQLDIGKAAVSRAVDSLEAKGYIIRQQDLQDRRAYQLVLTKKAREFGPEIEAVYDHVYRLAMTEISPTERELLLNLLRRIAANLADEA